MTRDDLRVLVVAGWASRRGVRMGPGGQITIWLMIATGAPGGANVVLYCSGTSQETYAPALTSVVQPGFTYITGNEQATTCEADGTGIPGDNTFVSQVQGRVATPGLTCATLTKPDSGTTVYTWNNGHKSTWKWSGTTGAGPTTGELSATRTGLVTAGDYKGSELSENIVYDNDVSTCDSAPLSTNTGDAEWALYPDTNSPF